MAPYGSHALPSTCAYRVRGPCLVGTTRRGLGMAHALHPSYTSLRIALFGGTSVGAAPVT